MDGRSRSLRRRLAATVLGTTLAALVVALVLIGAYDYAVYRTAALADADTQAELLVRMSASALAFDDARAAKENVELLSLRPQVRAAAIYTARGAIFASFSRDGAELEKLPRVDSVRFDARSLELWKRVVKDNEILGTVYLRLDTDVVALLRGYSAIALGVVLAALAIAWFVASRLQRRVVDPILGVAAVARASVETGDYSRRAPPATDDEVGVLVASFNAMLEEIDRRTRQLESSNADLAREVAERVRAEEENLRLNAVLEDRVRERTSQLESANKELEAFSYTVSHDLRAPLRAIDGFSQALLEDFPAEVPEEARRYLARIRQATLRMGQLIEDLLNLSRVSRMAVDRRACDVTDIARQVVADCAQRDPARNVDVSVREGMSADADPRLLRAALENLIGNAWKFTSTTPHARIEVGSLRDGAHVTYFVRDNGAGFDMAYADKLFTAFQRLHGANEFAGTGIGLATVQRIVHRHGGRIWADAQVGKGAAFYFTLSYDGRTAAEEEAA